MSAVLGGGVVFSYQTWSTRYPELAASVAAPLAAAYFVEAQLYCDNTPCTQIPTTDAGGNPVLATLLNMMVAHIAALNAPIGGVASSPLVGRISSATEGSVTVQTDNQYPPGSVQWYQQTKYGAAFWRASGPYRRFQYAKGPRRNMDPYNPLRGGR